MPHKILIYYEQEGYGGVDTHMAHLVNHWPEPDDEIFIVSNPGNEGLEYLESQLRNFKVRIIKINNIFHNQKIRLGKYGRALNQIYTHFRFIRKFPKFHLHHP